MKSYNTPHFQKALDLYWDQKYQELFDYCTKAVAEEKENIELWKLFGAGAGMIKRADIAMICYETVVNLDPSDDCSLMNLITAYFHNDEVEKAIDLLFQVEDRYNDAMNLRLKEIMVEAQNQYNVAQIIDCLPESIASKLLDS